MSNSDDENKAEISKIVQEGVRMLRADEIESLAPEMGKIKGAVKKGDKAAVKKAVEDLRESRIKKRGRGKN